MARLRGWRLFLPERLELSFAPHKWVVVYPKASSGARFVTGFAGCGFRFWFWCRFGCYSFRRVGFLRSHRLSGGRFGFLFGRGCRFSAWHDRGEIDAIHVDVKEL